MKIKYNDCYNRLVLDGEDTLIIPTANSKAVINVDSDSLNIMNKKYGIKISLENFCATGTKFSLKEKLKMIFRILLL